MALLWDAYFTLAIGNILLLFLKKQHLNNSFTASFSFRNNNYNKNDNNNNNYYHNNNRTYSFIRRSPYCIEGGGENNELCRIESRTGKNVGSKN